MNLQFSIVYKYNFTHTKKYEHLPRTEYLHSQESTESI